MAAARRDANTRLQFGMPSESHSDWVQRTRRSAGAPGVAQRTDALRRWLQTQGVQSEAALREVTLFCSTVEELARASPEDLTWLTAAWDPSDRATLLRAIDEARSAMTPEAPPAGRVFI
jgi:hypothetical protein